MKRASAPVLAVAFAAASACGSAQHGATLTLPLDEDPVALLPSGADLVVDLDVEQLRQWPPARRFLELLPDAARARIHRLGFDPLDDVDAAVLAVSQLGTTQVSSTLILRGRLDLQRARGALGPAAEVIDVDYRGTQVAEGPEGALAAVLPRLLVLGSRADVRRVIDLARGEGESLRGAAGDRALLKAFARAPTARSGRPAIMAGMVPPDPLREQLRHEQLPGADFEWLAISLAVGDGFDVGGVAGMRGAAEASSMVAAAKVQLSDFAGRLAVRLLGLKPFLDPVVLLAREAEVHLAYRLAAPPVERMLAKLEAVQSMARPAQTSQTPKVATPKSSIDE